MRPIKLNKYSQESINCSEFPLITNSEILLKFDTKTKLSDRREIR